MPIISGTQGPVIMPGMESAKAAAASERPNLASDGFDAVTDPLLGSSVIALRRLVEVCEPIELITLVAQLIGQRAGLWCGHSHLRS
jgi:hypothetical protein